MIKNRKCSSCGVDIQYEIASELCPSCGAKYWDKPTIERELFELQDSYSETKSSHVLGEMYKKLVHYSRSLILKRIRNRYIMQEEILEERASDCATKIIERILSSGIRIENSFGGYLGWVINGVLYGSKKDDNHESLNVKISTEDDLESNISYFGFDPLISHGGEFEKKVIDETSGLYDTVYSLIENAYLKIHNSAYSKSESLLFLCALKNRLYHKNESFMNQFYDMWGNLIKDDVRKVELVMMNYLKEELVNG